MKQTSLFAEPRGTAIISPCQLYRYRLTRPLGDPTHSVLFVMLNPSKADETEDDPTIVRCTTFARDWGFGALVVCNLFAWRSTDMTALAQATDPVGVTDLGVGTNDDHIIACAQAARRIVFAWGNGHRSFQRVFAQRAKDVTKLVTEHAKVLPLAFRMTKAQQPEHPLYQKADAQLIPVHGLELLRQGL